MVNWQGAEKQISIIDGNENMKIEYEATFENINPDEFRAKLISIGAKLKQRKFLQKRDVFNLPNNQKNSWLRVRKEADRNTLSLKICDGDKIENQKEIFLIINDYDAAVDFLKEIGCQWKSYQETKRELWLLGETEITIDWWPFLEPFVEIEGKSEKAVRKVCEKLELNYQQALFCSVGELYKRKYGVSLDKVNNQTAKLVFEMKNPFRN